MSVQDRDYMKADYRPQKKKFIFTGIHNKILFLLWLIKKRLLKPWCQFRKKNSTSPPIPEHQNQSHQQHPPSVQRDKMHKL